MCIVNLSSKINFKELMNIEDENHCYLKTTLIQSSFARVKQMEVHKAISWTKFKYQLEKRISLCSLILKVKV